MDFLLAAEGHSWGSLAVRFGPVTAVSLVTALVATPICRRIALARGIVDRPDTFLKPHAVPTPYLGGVAIYAGWLAGIVVAFALRGVQVDTGLLAGIAVAGLVTLLIGLFDDLRVMSSKVKLVSNIAVALFVLGLGLGDDLVNVVIQVMRVELQPWERLIYSVPVTVFIVVGASNATNLIDGLDGLCTGVLGIISIGFVILAGYLWINYPTAELGEERVVLALAVLGAAAGFLPFNRNPAKIFMGDAGSMLLGLNAAILILMFGEARMVRWMIGALMVFGLPIADMLLTLVRRWRNGRPLMTGDRSHYYDQLCDRGFGVRKVVAISYLLTSAFVLVGVSVIFLRTRHAILAYFVAIMVVVAAVWKFNMAGLERARPAGGASGPSDGGMHEETQPDE